MNDITLAIRQEAARILRERLVDLVIGFEPGTLPLTARPAFIAREEEAERLVFHSFCPNNLAVYLPRRPREERIGIICRGCESRAIHALILEYRHDREKLYLIGIPCQGILDQRKIEDRVGERVIAASEQGEEIILTCPEKEYNIRRDDLLHDSCVRCMHPDPTGADIVLGNPLRKGPPKQGATLAEKFGTLRHEERHAIFVRESDRCIRCYACREACPMCYCTECFVDCTLPRWAESMTTPNGTQFWHIIRAFHQTGRCVGCGACERACPMDISLACLTEKLNDDMRTLYGFEAGVKEKEPPPLTAFALDDRTHFIR